MRRKKKGWPPTVNVGYRGPKAARNLHPSGYKEVLVKNVEEIGAIDPKTHAMRIAHTVGRRKKIRIITEARKRKIKILNIKEAAEKTQEPIEEKEETEETEEKQEPEQKEKPKRKKKTKKTEEEAEEQ
jgi:large subunit ribosomal protein L32e